jgi:hypothetical protein
MPRLRQAIPTKFSTAYRHDADGANTPTFCTWWMWGGHCFNVKRWAI